MGRVSNKVALITGGASGIGFAIAELFIKEGSQVVITDFDRSAGEKAARALGCNALFIEQDVSNEGDWIRMIPRILSERGRIDILVNNAGISSAGASQDPETVSLEEWRRVQAVNVEGVVLGCKQAIAVMRKGGGGSIVNISSMAGFIGTPKLSAYGASKAAVYQFTKTVALHCARNKYNIRCNSVHPGIVSTKMFREAFSKEEQEEMRKTIPLGEFSVPKDVAMAALYLASDESKHVTGSKIVVDGGITMQ
ncbi:MAG: glucose 1-dehydrogenase [Spirochaetales bacterium]|nr:glucose 1-dehydrogenase [Spirochaetales bacterium]